MIDSAQQSKAAIFQCDCGGEGLVVVAESDADLHCDGLPYINIAFFGMGRFSDDRLSWKERIRWIWWIIRTGNPFVDMVMLRSNVARNFANHILYLLSRNKPVKVEPNYLVKLHDLTPNELPPTWGKLTPIDLGGHPPDYTDPLYSNG